MRQKAKLPQCLPVTFSTRNYINLLSIKRWNCPRRKLESNLKYAKINVAILKHRQTLPLSHFGILSLCSNTGAEPLMNRTRSAPTLNLTNASCWKSTPANAPRYMTSVKPSVVRGLRSRKSINSDAESWAMTKDTDVRQYWNPENPIGTYSKQKCTPYK